jgi:multidrug efflux pump subunit AcrA (membrane-fusion protein)
MRHAAQRTLLALLVVSLTAALSGCTQVEESESDYQSSIVTPIPGNDDVAQVRFTALAAKRADVKTARVSLIAGHVAIPYASLIYNEEGRTYTYTSPKALVYVRKPIAVDRVAGDRVLLKKGPPVGTTVITTGAAEIYSAEFGVEE